MKTRRGVSECKVIQKWCLEGILYFYYNYTQLFILFFQLVIFFSETKNTRNILNFEHTLKNTNDNTLQKSFQMYCRSKSFHVVNSYFTLCVLGYRLN